MRRPQIPPNIVAAGMLLIGVSAMPFSYYTYLRWVVMIAAAVTAFVAFKSGSPAWFLAAWLYVAVAVLFNPFQPFGFARSTWLPIDLIAAVLLVLGCVPALPRTPGEI